MRPLEIALAATILLWWLGIVSGKVSTLPRNVIAVAALVIAIAQIGIEGYRWHLMPLYFLVCLAIAWPFLGEWVNTLPVFVRTFGLLCAIGATLLPALLPVWQLPTPTGSHTVGSTIMAFTDESRIDRLSPTNAPRRLLVQAWYPADIASTDTKIPYWPDTKIVSENLSRMLWWPAYLFHTGGLVETHSYENATFAAAQNNYPVLIFSHGYGSALITQNANLMEELASHGYAVFSIAHPYESTVAVFPDGEVIQTDKEYTDSFFWEFAKSSVEHARWGNDDPTPERNARMERYLTSMPKSIESMETWAADTIFVIDQLEQLNVSDPLFAERLDLERLGVLGMSFGGAVAADVCMLDNRCKAGLNMDGFQFGTLIIDGEIEQPFFFFESGSNRRMHVYTSERVSAETYRLTINTSRHSDFEDFAIFSNIRPPITKTRNPSNEEILTIIRQYTVAFFNQYLLDIPSPLLNEGCAGDPDCPLTQHPELEFEFQPTKK